MSRNRSARDSSPTRDKVKYLKTLNDQVLSKTQMALLAINDYQIRRSRLAIAPTSSFTLQPCTSHLDRKSIHLSLQQNSPLTISMLRQSVEYYKIDCRSKIFPLKLQFKQLKNQFRFMASFKYMFPGEGSCEYDFVIDKAMKKSIKPQAAKDLQTLFICLQAKNNIGIMVMEFSFYQEMLETLRGGDVRSRVTKRRNKGEELEFSPMKTFSYISRNNFRYRGDETPEITRESRFERVMTEDVKEEPSRSQTNFRVKNIFEATNYQELSLSRKHILSQKKYEKVRDNKVRHEDYWLHKEKQRLLREKASQNKKIISLKQVRASQEMYQKRILTRDITSFLYLHKLLTFIHEKKQGFVDTMRSKIKIKMFQNKFCKSLKKSYSKTCSIMPSKKNRDRCTIYSLLYLLTRVNKPIAQQKSTRLLINLLHTLTPTLRVVDGFDQATVFRRKLRLVQKVWRTKYHTRLELVKMAGQRHVNTLLDTHQKFSGYEGEWKKGKHLERVCCEYIREEAGKFNELYIGYLRKIDELYDQRKLNEQIKKSNRTLPVKQQKPLLNIPPEPIQPHYRFFRDLDTLRGMIRSWFELEVKKSQKRAKSRWD